MSVWSAGDKNMTFDQVKSDAQKAQKDIKLVSFWIHNTNLHSNFHRCASRI